MNRILLVAALLAGMALLPHATAHAQPHQQVQMDDVTVPTPELSVWLQRLTGSFSVEGMTSVPGRADCPTFCVGIKGKANCVAVGKGPGVQCMLNAAWEDQFEIIMYSEDPNEPVGVFELPGGVSYLDPSVALFGLDPGKSAINYLLVDNKGLPEGKPGQVNGNRATFRMTCVNAPVLFNAMKPQRTTPYRTCERIIRIDARPDAKVVLVTIDIEINDDPFTQLTLSLRRTQESGMTDKASPPAR